MIIDLYEYKENEKMYNNPVDIVRVSYYEFGNKSLDVTDNPVATMRGALHPSAVLGLNRCY